MPLKQYVHCPSPPLAISYPNSSIPSLPLPSLPFRQGKNNLSVHVFAIELEHLVVTMRYCYITLSPFHLHHSSSPTAHFPFLHHMISGLLCSHFSSNSFHDSTILFLFSFHLIDAVAGRENRKQSQQSCRGTKGCRS